MTSPDSSVPAVSPSPAGTEATTEPMVTFPKEQLDRLMMSVRSVLDRRASSALQQARRDALMAAVVHHERDPRHTHDDVLTSAETFLDWLLLDGAE